MTELMFLIKTYSELIQLPTFEERFEYLRENGMVGQDTFGFNRYMNQRFYKSKEWKQVRDYVIVRDNGCDLAIFDRKLYGRITVHHMVPITEDDIEKSSEFLLNPEFLITVSKETHNAIHYGDSNLIVPSVIVERKKNDTCPWR